MKTKILIIKLGALGDVLRTTCILPALKKKHKKSSIIWLIKKEAIPLLENNPFLDKIYYFDFNRIKNINKEKFDLIVNLDENIEACRIANPIKTKVIGAYLEGNQIKYTDDAEEWFNMSLISKFGKEKADQLKKENNKSYPKILVNMLGLDFDNNRDKPQLILSEEEKKFAFDFLKKNYISKDKLLIGLNTDAGDRWEAKKMSKTKTIQLAEDLAKEFDTQIISLSESWKKRSQEIIKNSKIKIIDSGNNDLRKFSSIINICDLIITSDSLVLHLAVALNKKHISFFGPTSAVEIENYDLGEKIISSARCDFCYRHKCQFEKSCLEKLSNKLFIEAAKKILKI
ncbi:MAG: heptosyltransferase II [Parcubacteria group bacterium Athens1014_10]|nr:MAG: heptosyltransferase II [Parcubacteria group bacterium Athens1014_10]TSD05559.1 MAG: heptosyltransferase II [Parcubacteria group bacterium Athens0714_12]